jgi:YD repeat-containing protein
MNKKIKTKIKAMKKLLFLLLATAGFVACKKSSVDAPVTPVSNETKVKTSTSGTTISTFYYDSKGRQLKIENSNGSKEEYEYLPGIINRKSYSTSGVFVFAYKYELNADGLVYRSTISNNPSYEELRQYNADKTLAKYLFKANGLTNSADYFYSNGNCDSVRFIGNDGKWSSTNIHTFYTDKINVLTDAITGEDFNGKDDKNMLKSDIYRYPDGTTNDMATYTYAYDAQGRVIKSTRTQGNDISINLISYY